MLYFLIHINVYMECVILYIINGESISYVMKYRMFSTDLSTKIEIPQFQMLK